MKKRILSTILCLILIVSAMLSACGKTSNSDKDKDKVDSTVNQDVVQDDQQDEQAKEEETAEPTIHLIANGASEYVIVRSANATETEVYAAEELQSYLKKISGAKLSIVTDKKAATEKEIVVGKTNRESTGAFNRTELGEDGFVIKTTGSKVWLVGGGNRGTLYSVYSFLEEYLGCRYYTEEIEKVPETKNVSIPDIAENKQIPQIVYRDTDWKDYYGEDISVKQKLNAILWGRTLSDKVGGGMSVAGGAGGHSHFEFVPPATYFESHPEYYSMNAEGKRVAVQLCLSNPDVLKIATKAVKEKLRKYPDAEYIAVSQQDGGMACLCDACKKIYAEEGDAYSGTDIRFVNAIGNAIKDEFPNVQIWTYAYEYTRKAPKTAPVDNVVVELCTMGTCFNHEKEGNKSCSAAGLVNQGVSTNVYNTYFCDDVEAWGKLTDNILIYDYSTNYFFWCMTWTDFDLLQKNINWYARFGTNMMIMQGNQHSKSIEFGELRAYLIAKLLWDPYMSEEEYYAHMDDFLTGVYGPGGKYIRDYIELSQKLTEEQHFGVAPGAFETYPTTTVEVHDASELPKDLTVEMVKNYKKTDWTKYWNWYTDVKENPLTEQGKILFGKALAKAETKTQKEQIQKIYLQVDYLKSYYYYNKIVEADGELYDLIAEFIQKNSGKFTEEEAKNLPNLIYEVGTQQSNKKYAAYNKSLCDALVEAGVTYRWEGSSLDGWQSFNFEEIPSMWPS